MIATNRLKSYPVQMPVERPSRLEAALLGIGVGTAIVTVLVVVAVLGLAVVGAVTVYKSAYRAKGNPMEMTTKFRATGEFRPPLKGEWFWNPATDGPDLAVFDFDSPCKLLAIDVPDEEPVKVRVAE